MAEDLFLRQGFDRTSLEQIATGSGYSVGSIYNFFAGKDAVYSAVLERHATSLGDLLRTAAESAGTGIDKVVEMARAAVLDLRGAPGRARLTATSMTTNDREPEENRGAFGAVLARYAEALGEGQRDGTVRGGNPRHLAQFVGGLVLAQAQVDPEITGAPDGIDLGDFLDIVRGALARPGSEARPAS
ncbi:transcriptional regulator, TetR family [Trujillonella endophytica]|uniref:Transcriptional regulator, TetR family n=1 Tax=Trujillonella endophytica TaxID=673521 RepID=A0A1H8PRP5_9ACTN|nr:transcriptional regulator, TetR family [Trujillella endophytica]